MPTLEESIKALFKHYGYDVENDKNARSLFYDIIRAIDPHVGQQAKLTVLLRNIKNELKAFND